MTPVDIALLERKLGQIADRLDHLARFRSDGWEVYRESFERRKATEKILQELIEAAIDVNSHLLVELGQGAPADYHGSFLELERAGVLPAELAAALAPAAGLRNRLVHQYALIDDRLVFEAVGVSLQLFPRYLAAIRRALDGGD